MSPVRLARPAPRTPSTGNQPGPRGDGQLAETGSELPLDLALPAGAGALLVGGILYRRARTAA